MFASTFLENWALTLETVEKCPEKQRPCCSDNPALSFPGSPWAGVVSEDQGDGDALANGVGQWSWWWLL